MTFLEKQVYSLIWDAGNEAGEGFPVGEPGDNIFRAIEAAGDEVTGGYPYIDHDADTRTGFFMAVATRPDGSEYVVYDVHGPWAVNVEGETK